ncbi:MAG: HNH endonuclease [candidate division Zixibacteria bacterium]|nr:HNH endonuclease [candidate division Zixibacteria bacterium]
MPSAEDFQSELNGMFASAQQQGKSFVEIKSGDLHRAVGGYPGHVHRLPTCCRVMRRNMKSGDEILHQPPGGAGATLIIRFQLPR